MKTFAMALAAATMTVSGSMALPMDAAVAKKRHDDRRYYTSDNGVRYWRGDNGRYYCKRSDGTTGLIVGGAVGALAGRAIDTDGDRTLGTVVGAAAGALLGREVDRGRKISCR
ncbi:glycine zipper 2TM domain-containing protein [Qipengyuania sp.]|uniref:glycine zipper 2TM domain-containing protein n=1 Tax=Qipengyuania sp. TaxID=2004515 RepID=UPI0035C838CD